MELALRNVGAHVQPRQEQAVRVRHFGAQQQLTGAGIDRLVGKKHPPLVRVGRAVIQGNLHGKINALERAGLEFLFNAHQIGGRLGDVHIKRVKLLNLRHIGGAAGGDQRAFGNIRLADDAGNRRQHLGILHIDFRLLDGRFRDHDIGGGNLHFRQRLVISLARHRLLLDQRRVAVGGTLRQRLVGLRQRQLRLRRLQIGLINRIINLIQLLSGAHQRAFLKQALLHDTAHLRLNHRFTRSLQPCRQILGHNHRLRLDDHHLRRRRFLLLCGSRRRVTFLLLAALLFLRHSGRKQRCRRQGNRQKSHTNLHHYFLVNL